MSDDLVKRLRDHVEKRGGASFQNGAWDMMLSAADRIEALEAALAEAIEDIEHWGGYAGEYFQDKWDLKGNIAKHRAALGEKKDG